MQYGQWKLRLRGVGRRSKKYRTGTRRVATTDGDEESAHQRTPGTIEQTTAKQTTTKPQEYIHIQYNAWEFQASDILWGALVDKIFNEVIFAIGGCGTFNRKRWR